MQEDLFRLALCEAILQDVVPGLFLTPEQRRAKALRLYVLVREGERKRKREKVREGLREEVREGGEERGRGSCER